MSESFNGVSALLEWIEGVDRMREEIRKVLSNLNGLAVLICRHVEIKKDFWHEERFLIDPEGASSSYGVICLARYPNQQRRCVVLEGKQPSELSLPKVLQIHSALPRIYARVLEIFPEIEEILDGTSDTLKAEAENLSYF